MGGLAALVLLADLAATPPEEERPRRPPPTAAFAGGFRLGGALPLRAMEIQVPDTYGTVETVRAVGGLVPITLDVGVRVGESWFFGGYGEFSWMFPRGGAATMSRAFGGGAQARLRPDNGSFWLGATVGVHHLQSNGQGPTGRDSAMGRLVATGVDVPGVLVGVDGHVGETARLGVYAGVSLMWLFFSRATEGYDFPDSSTGGPSAGIYPWVSFGAHIFFGP